MPPPNTRPRYVFPPLSEIMNQDFGQVQPTPPFMPGQQQGGGIGDLVAQINQILAQPSGVPAPPPQSGGLSGFFRGALQALPQSIGVGLSAINPEAGGALLRQIEQQRAIKFQQEQAEKERQERLDMLKKQIGIDLIKGEITERRDIAREGRQREFSVEERKAKETQDMLMFNAEADLRTRLQNSSNENSRKLAEMQTKDNALARATQSRTALVESGVSPALAVPLAQKLAEGNYLQITNQEWQAYLKSGQTDAEFEAKKRQKTLDKMDSEIYENRLRAEAARAGGQGKGAQNELFENYLNVQKEYLTKPLVKMQDRVGPNGETIPGEITWKEGILNDPTKINQVERQLSPMEAKQYFDSTIGPSLLQGVTQVEPGLGGMPTPVSGAQKGIEAQHLDVHVNKLRDLGASDDEVLEELKKYVEEGGSAEAVEGVILRANIEAGKNVSEEQKKPKQGKVDNKPPGISKAEFDKMSPAQQNEAIRAAGGGFLDRVLGRLPTKKAEPPITYDRSDRGGPPKGSGVKATGLLDKLSQKPRIPILEHLAKDVPGMRSPGQVIEEGRKTKEQKEKEKEFIEYLRRLGYPEITTIK